MADVPHTVEDYRDEHALLCERFALSLEDISDDGSVAQFDTHLVTFGDHIMLGQAITTVGLGLTNASIPRRHALGEDILTPEQQQRAAILYCSASLITEVYASNVARSVLRSSGIKLPNDKVTAPVLVIGEADTEVLRSRGSLLHTWMAKVLQRVVTDPYYEQFH